MDLTTIHVLVVIFIATLIRSVFGFGEALVAVPLLALRIPVTVAAPLAVLVSVMVAGVIVLQDWRKIEMRSAAGLTLSSLFGIPLGLLLLTRVNGHAVKAILGIIIAGFSIYSLTAKRKLHLEKDHPAWLIGSGFCSGILGGAYGMNGPPLAVYGSLRRWSPQQFRATLQGYFLVASFAGLIGYGGGVIGPRRNAIFPDLPPRRARSHNDWKDAQSSAARRRLFSIRLRRTDSHRRRSAGAGNVKIISQKKPITATVVQSA